MKFKDPICRCRHILRGLGLGNLGEIIQATILLLFTNDMIIDTGNIKTFTRQKQKKLTTAKQIYSQYFKLNYISYTSLK